MIATLALLLNACAQFRPGGPMIAVRPPVLTQANPGAFQIKNGETTPGIYLIIPASNSVPATTIKALGVSIQSTTNPGTASGAAAAHKGTPKVSITIPMSQASFQLQRDSTTGMHFNTLTIDQLKTVNGNQLEVEIEYKIKDAFISGIQQNLSSNSRPDETLTIIGAAFEYEYASQDQQNGATRSQYNIGTQKAY